jgi:signal transduction histidine kinase
LGSISADAKGINITTDLDANAGALLGNPDRLRQTILNLLKNAVKFAPAAGRIHIQLSRVHSHVEVSVADTGRGIAVDFLPHIFERFRQQDELDSRQYGGLGLGLGICEIIG